MNEFHTNTLAWLFDHEDDLPTNVTCLLQRIGWVFAQRLYDKGISNGAQQSLSRDLECICRGDRGRVEWLGHKFDALVRTLPPTTGWVLQQIRYVEKVVNETRCRQLYKYTSAKTGKFHLLDCVVNGEGAEVVMFKLRGFHFHWYQCRDVWTISRPRLGVNDTPETVEQLEIVTPRAGSVQYAFLNRATKTCLLRTTFTNTFTTTVHVKKWLVPSELPPFGERYGFHTLTEMEQLYGNHTYWTRFRPVYLHMKAVTDTITEWDVFTLAASVKKELPLMSRRLTEKLQSRFFRIGIKLVQELEERRSRDPIKKCAACAVQAAKSQLVLGIEPPSAKRQRTSDARDA